MLQEGCLLLYHVLISTLTALFTLRVGMWAAFNECVASNSYLLEWGSTCRDLKLAPHSIMCMYCCIVSTDVNIAYRIVFSMGWTVCSANKSDTGWMRVPRGRAVTLHTESPGFSSRFRDARHMSSFSQIPIFFKEMGQSCKMLPEFSFSSIYGNMYGVWWEETTSSLVVCFFLLSIKLVPFRVVFQLRLWTSFFLFCYSYRAPVHTQLEVTGNLALSGGLRAPRCCSFCMNNLGCRVSIILSFHMLRHTHAWEAGCFSNRLRKSWCQTYNFFLFFVINCFARFFFCLFCSYKNGEYKSIPVAVCDCLPLPSAGSWCVLFIHLILYTLTTITT